MTKLKTILGAGVLAAAGVAGIAAAGVTAEQAARLGADLTPMGAEKGRQRGGHDPGLERRHQVGGGCGRTGLQAGRSPPGPVRERQAALQDRRLEHVEVRGEPHGGPQGAARRRTRRSYFLNVYPSHRSAAFPQRIYDAVKGNATTAKLTGTGTGVTGAIGGPPFPIPQSGIEVIWNHILRYRADVAERYIGQAAVSRTGTYNLVKFHDETMVTYALPGATEAALDNVIVLFIQETTAPARLAGEILLVHETLDQSKEQRRAWLYNPGQRRVRRAPNVAFDNPGTGSDGLRTSDQFDLYNGSPERYDWKLVGKQEIVVPYNAYKLHSNKVKNDDIIKPLHINQDLARYELHRVWVVDATLKAGQRHLYKRRTFYIDEDSWQILVVDCYDDRDQLWRIQEGHSIEYYDVPTFWTTLELTYDLQAGRYLALGLDNEEPQTVDFNVKRTAADFTPAAIARRGTR